MSYRMTPVNIPPLITTPTHPEMITEIEVKSDIEEDNGEDLDIEDNGVIELQENNLLFDYMPDDDYNPDSMEQECYPENLNWRLDDLSSDGLTPPPDLYDGSGPKLCPWIGTKFNTVLEACGIGGGFTYELMKCITAKSNTYACPKFAMVNLLLALGETLLLRRCTMLLV